MSVDSWNESSHPFTKQEYGKWEIKIPANSDGSCPLTHMSRVQLLINNHLPRISPWAKYVKPHEGFVYQQHIYNPSEVRTH